MFAKSLPLVPCDIHLVDVKFWQLHVSRRFLAHKFNFVDDQCFMMIIYFADFVAGGRKVLKRCQFFGE